MALVASPAHHDNLVLLATEPHGIERGEQRAHGATPPCPRPCQRCASPNTQQLRPAHTKPRLVRNVGCSWAARCCGHRLLATGQLPRVRHPGARATPRLAPAFVGAAHVAQQLRPVAAARPVLLLAHELPSATRPVAGLLLLPAVAAVGATQRVRLAAVVAQRCRQRTWTLT